jgi:superfamily II DNA/RNA helicase
LKDQKKNKPTAVQAETLEVTTDSDRKKFNYLIRAVNGAGKTMSFLLPILNSIEPNVKFAEDKTL